MKNVVTELMKLFTGILLIALFSSGSCSKKYSRDYAPLPDGSYVHNGYEESPQINQYGTFEELTPSYDRYTSSFLDAVAGGLDQSYNDLQFQRKLDERDRRNEAEARKEKERKLRAFKRDLEWEKDRYQRQSRPYSSSN